MFVRILVCVATVVVSTGCTARDSPGSPGTSTPMVPSHQPSVIAGPAGTMVVAVQESPTRPQREVRMLRVEDAAGKTVVERRYRTESAELSEPLAVGRYRVISWVQDCGGPCAEVPDDKLAAPSGICGLKVGITANGMTNVRVDAPSDNACTMTVGA